MLKQLLLFINFRTSFVGGKHLESQVNAFRFYFPVTKRYPFHYLMKLAPIPLNQSSFEILQLLDIWRYQSFVTLFFSSTLILL